MGTQEQKSPNSATLKVPLGFSFVLALGAGIVTLFASSGGTKHGLRWDLGGIAFGIAFVATLLVASLLTMTYKENPDYLSEGSGVNRKSSDRLKKDDGGTK
ncbi:hypothetical protein [Specibacter cremeus]|uniref:hypothetical protein n=1 Tax=Specibacter cremeus TaxID=1629051 RepID=UPI001F0C8719|nr:hypothetical protein [Specibacter cremeus]